MRLNNFLNEADERVRVIPTREEFMVSIEKYASKAYKNGRNIFRGHSSKDDFLYVEPTKITRKSPYAFTNYYNQLLSHLPSWEGWPKRNKSLICTTDNTKARQYNDSVYVVYPFNEANIGVCPKDDIWYSFNKGLDTDLNSLNLHLINLFQFCGLERDRTLNYDELIKNFKIVDDFFQSDFSNFNKLLEKHKSLYNFLKNIFYTNGGSNLFNCINRAMAPKLNNFSLVKSGKRILGNCEVWTDSPCLMCLWGLQG